MKIIKMSQRMRQYEISKEHGISRHAVQVTQKKHADVRNVWDMKKSGRPS